MWRIYEYTEICLNFFARVRRGPSFPTVDPLSDYGVAARVFEEGVLAHDMKFWGGVSILEMRGLM